MVVLTSGILTYVGVPQSNINVSLGTPLVNLSNLTSVAETFLTPHLLVEMSLFLLLES
jgi:hypothetical protein